MKSIVKGDKDFICELQAPCFQSLSATEIALIQTGKTQVQFRKGDNLTKQGAFASYILLMAKGLATQYIEDESNKSYNIRIIGPGEFIGLSSVFTDNTFSYSSVALTDCQVFLVDKAAIIETINNNGIFGFGLMRRYTDHNTNLYSKLKTILYKQMNGRLAETLLYINGFKAEFPDVFQLMVRKDIADFAGISTESAVKLLKQFEKDNLIKLDGKDIKLLNISELKDISKRG